MQTEVRARVERQLGSALTEDELLWLETFYVSDLSLDTADPEDMADRVRQVRRRRVQAGQGGSPAAQVIEDSTAALRPDHDALRLRMAAVSMLIANEARTDVEVRSFRKEVLRGRLVAWPDLAGWLKARAQREAPGQPDRLLPYLHLDAGESWERRLPVAPDGTLDRLRDLASLLARRYGWSDAQAVVFVLTDLPAVVEPLKWSIDLRTHLTGASRIHIEADPAMPPALVERAYRTARNSLMRAKGGRFKDIDDQRVVLAAWVTTQPADRSAEQQMKLWNRTVAKGRPKAWTYTRLDYFMRDIKVSQRRLLRPEYRTDLPLTGGGIQDLEEGK